MAAHPHSDHRLPSGTVTFLFTDIEGSSRMWETHPAAMRGSLAQHDAIVRNAIEKNGGYLFKTTGDGALASFSAAADAIAACIAAQRALNAHDWGDLRIKSRMALHSDTVEERDGDYFGPALNRTARLLSAGHGGQILLSLATEELVRDHLPPDVGLKDLGERRLKDLIRPERVYQITAPDLPLEFPSLRTLDAHPNNLPQQLTSFIGREREIAEIEALLSKARLLTLTGSGGSGKTRLSLQVAADTLEQFQDGVWCVELAMIADPALAPQTVATAVGIKEQSGKALLQTLVEQLKGKQIMLLLDNCEHLLDACAQIANALLRECPRVQILATSREALGIAGEQAYRVPSLSLPDRKELQTAHTLSQYESVRLFIDRALLVRPDFIVTNSNAPALASLCWHLDGIPLAIELAAARVRSLSIEEIDGKLDQRFRLLTGGSRTAMPRQQTLRSLIDWSYDLLHDTERRILQRLSVFAGGWTLDAAEQVCIDAEIVHDAVLDLLTSLSDKSLVVTEELGGRSRYRLLETVRQYAAERLLERGGTEAVRGLHRDYYLALAEQAEPRLVGAEQAEWLQRLEVEHDNLRSGLSWSLSEPNPEKALRFCSALWRFWLIRGHFAEGRELCVRALAKTHPAERTRLLANVLNAAGGLACYQCDFADAVTRHRKSLEIRRHLDDRRGIAGSLNNLGNVELDQGNLAAAQSLYEESLGIMRELGDRNGMAGLQTNLGGVAQARGDYVSARMLHEESLALSRALSDRIGIATSLSNLGHVAGALRDHAAAEALCREAIGILRSLGDNRGVANSLGGLAAAVAALGDSIRAARIWGVAGRLREELGSPLAPTEQRRQDEQVSDARARLGDDAAFDRAWQEGRSATIDQAMRKVPLLVNTDN